VHPLQIYYRTVSSQSIILIQNEFSDLLDKKQSNARKRLTKRCKIKQSTKTFVTCPKCYYFSLKHLYYYQTHSANNRMEILPIWLRDRIRVIDASERSAINIRKAAMCNNTNIIETLLSSNHSAFKQRICTSLSKLSGPGYQPLFWDRGFGCRHLRGLLQSPQRQQWCGDGQF